MRGNDALSALFPLLRLVCLWVGELAHHGQHQVDADDGGDEPSANDAEVQRRERWLERGGEGRDEDGTNPHPNGAREERDAQQRY